MHPFIENYLSDYIASPNPDFAIMIVGEWGSGKTFFIEDYIAHNLKKCKNKPEAIYVSLNGMNRLSQINQSIVQSLHRVLGSKVLRGVIACGAVAMNARFGISSSDALSLFDSASSLLKIEAKLIVFDDLERCSIPLNEVFGFVASLLHDGIHVVVVGSEDELKKRCAAYDKIKEKIVGKTFRIPENIESIYDVIIEDESFASIKSILCRLREDLIQDFKCVPNCYNYRAFKHAIRDFNYWYKSFSSQVRENELFINAFARRFISLSYEYQLGNLTKDNFGNCKNPFDEKEKPTDYDKVLLRHNIAHCTFMDMRPYLIVPEEMFGRMMFAERISQEEVNQTILETFYFVKEKDKTEWQRLMEWDVLDDAEVRDLLKSVFLKIKGHEYVIPEEILHVFCLLCHLSEYGIVKRQTSDIVRRAKQYIYGLRKKDRLLEVQNTDCCEPFGQTWKGYSYHGEFDNRVWYVELRDELANQVANVESLKVKSWILSNSPGGIDRSAKHFLQKVQRSGEWANRPVFQFVDSKKFLRAFRGLPNRDKRQVGEILNYRYSGCCQRVKDEESVFWAKVIDLLTSTAVPTSRSAAGKSSVLQLDILYNLINATWKFGRPAAKMRIKQA